MPDTATPVHVTHAATGVLSGDQYLVREYANGDRTICVRRLGDRTWGPEVELIAEAVA